MSVPPGNTCVANAALTANFEGQYWTSSATGSGVTFSAAPGGPTGISVIGVGTTPGNPQALVEPNFGFTDPNDLISNNALPAGLPSPGAVSNVSFILGYEAVGSSTVYLSYTGQTCATASSSGSPTITSSGIVPVYSTATTIQPGSWVSIFGSNLASAATTWTGNFPTTLGGTSVTIDGKPAYLWYVSPTQINLQAPDDTATGSVNVVVTTSAGTATSTVTLGEFGPSFSLLDSKHVAGIILRTNGSGAYGGGSYDIVGPTGSSLGYATVAAKAGDVLELFGVGFGPTNPTVAAGQVYSGTAPTTNPVTVTIDNVAVTPSFAGITSAGLYQINVTIPSGLGTGDVPLLATVGGVQTPPVVMISLQ